MTLPAGTISMSQVAAELGISQTGLSLDHSWVRQLAGAGASPAAVSMSGLQSQTAQPTWSGNPGSGPAMFISMSVPFFRGTTSGVGTTSSPTQPVTLSFSVAPNWNGNILITNTSTNVSQLLSQQNSTTWTSTGSPINLFRANTTDNFKLSPSN